LAVFIIFFGVFFVVIARWHAQIKRKRRGDMQQMALHLGLSFAPSNPRLLHSLNQFHLFSTGHTRSLCNVLSGVIKEVDVNIFDFTYTLSSGNNNNTFQRSVIVFEDDNLHLPSFALMPQIHAGLFSAILNGQDFDFGEDPNFSRKFILRGPSEQAVRNLFQHPLRAAFLKSPTVGLHVEGFESVVVLFVDRHVKVPSYHSLVNEGLRLLQALGHASR